MRGVLMLRSVELWRRLFLAFCLGAVVCLTLYASLETMVSLTPVDFAYERQHPLYPSFSTEERDLPLDAYIQFKTKGRLFEVSGPDWEVIFQNIASGQFAFRVPAEDYPPRFLSSFFFPQELPSIEIPPPNDRTYLMFRANGEARYLKLTTHSYSDQDFQLGIGLNRQKPPTLFLFPLRSFAPGLLLLGLLVYILLPWPKHGPEDLYISRTRIVLSDLVSMVLFIMFFSLPFFVVGGTMQTLRVWWGFCAFIWPLSMLGALLFKYAAWYSSLRIRILPDRLLLTTSLGNLNLPFSEIASYGQAIKVSPRWLIGGLAATVLSGGGQALSGAGQALISAGTQGLGYVLHLRDGRQVFLWYSDQRGSPIIDGYEKIGQALAAQGIHEESEPTVSSSLGLEYIVPAQGARNSSGAVFFENCCILFGPSALVILYGIL